MIAFGWVDENGEPTEMAKAGFKTPEQGCSTTLWAATSAKLEDKPGVHCEDCDIASPTDPESPMARYQGVDEHATSDESAERLWSISEELLAKARGSAASEALARRGPSHIVGFGTSGPDR